MRCAKKWRGRRCSRFGTNLTKASCEARTHVNAEPLAGLAGESSNNEVEAIVEKRYYVATISFKLCSIRVAVLCAVS